MSVLRELEPVKDLREVRWGFDRMGRSRFHTIGNLVPEGFEKYARIFHPAWRIVGQRQVRRELSDFERKSIQIFQSGLPRTNIRPSELPSFWFETELIREPVRWSEMAAYTKKRAHALMQWKKISVPKMHGVEIEPPDIGHLPDAITTPLQGLLQEHTPCDRCYLGVWQGYGGDYAANVPKTRSINSNPQTGREWDLFQAPLSMMGFRFFGDFSDLTASIVWAEDNSWWLNNDIDLDSTYFGGSIALLEDIFATKELEVWPVELEDEVTIDSDKLNT